MNQSEHGARLHNTKESSQDWEDRPGLSNPIRIFIIDDNRLFTDAISALLRHQAKIALVGLAADPNELLGRDRSQQIDVVLISAAMKRPDAVQVTRQIKEEFPAVKVILLGLDPRDEDHLEFIEAGASGYVLKTESITEMLRTIELVNSGRTPCSPRMAALVFAKITELSRERGRVEVPQQVKLTSREKEILQLIERGLSNKEIAQHLCITLYTVKNHVHNLLEKLQVDSRRGAIRYAYENGALKDSKSYQSTRGRTSSSLKQSVGSRESRSCL